MIGPGIVALGLGQQALPRLDHRDQPEFCNKACRVAAASVCYGEIIARLPSGAIGIGTRACQRSRCTFSGRVETRPASADKARLVPQTAHPTKCADAAAAKTEPRRHGMRRSVESPSGKQLSLSLAPEHAAHLLERQAAGSAPPSHGCESAEQRATRDRLPTCARPMRPCH